jgi:hypothetical protein
VSEAPVLKCVRCGELISFQGSHKLVFDDFALIRPSIYLDLYVCVSCGHIEMFDHDVARDQRSKDL